MEQRRPVPNLPHDDLLNMLMRQITGAVLKDITAKEHSLFKGKRSCFARGRTVVN